MPRRAAVRVATPTREPREIKIRSVVHRQVLRGSIRSPSTFDRRTSAVSSRCDRQPAHRSAALRARAPRRGPCHLDRPVQSIPRSSPPSKHRRRCRLTTNIHAGFVDQALAPLSESGRRRCAAGGCEHLGGPGGITPQPVDHARDRDALALLDLSQQARTCSYAPAHGSRLVVDQSDRQGEDRAPSRSISSRWGRRPRRPGGRRMPRAPRGPRRPSAAARRPRAAPSRCGWPCPAPPAIRPPPTSRSCASR